MPQGTILRPILFSVRLNDIQAVDSDSSTLAKFADDLTLSVLVKGNQDQAPQEVQDIFSWAQENLMTINLTRTKEMVVKGKAERPLPTVSFDIKQEELVNLSVFIFIVILQIGTSKLMPFSASRKAYAYITSVQEIWLWSRLSTPPLPYLIIPIFTYGISKWGVASYGKCLSKTDKFQKRAVRFGFLKEVSPVLSLLEVSGNTLWKSLTTSTEGPLVDLPPSKTRLLRNRGHSYVLPQIRAERFERWFINRYLFNFI